MKRETLSSFLLLFLAAGALWATYCILRPFLWPILTAVVLAIAFHPLFAVVVPLTAIGTILTQELHGLVETIGKQSQASGGFAMLLQSWLDRGLALIAPVV